jgi:hypothetical protein
MGTAGTMKKKVSMSKKTTEVNGISENYCRVCMKMKPIKEFYQAVDTALDKNNFMSICKIHCNEIYSNSLNIERNFEKALFRTCRILNIKWAPNAVEAVKTQITKMQNDGKEDIQVFGIYKSKLSTLSNLSDDTEMTFNGRIEDNTQISSSNDEITDDIDFNKYLKDFWGPDLIFEDYEFLESELARYKKTHKCDTATEESLLRQICFAELDIRKSRMGKGGGDASAVKRLQELMRTASVDPAKAATANSGQAKDTFSSFIKIIEENEPAEFYSGKDKELFKDFDNIDFYFKKYVTRPLKNFITQSRDFNVDTEDEIDEIVDISEE